MTETELMIEWLNDLQHDLKREIESLAPEALHWQPDPQANSIAVTVWHVARWVDVMLVRLLQDLPAETELWHTNDWVTKTHYDPRGIGYKGLGAITDYTVAEMLALPKFSAPDLVTYFDESCAALNSYLKNLPADGLHQRAPWANGKYTAYQILKTELQGFFGHLGEIGALKSAWERQLAREKSSV
jgi:hypothetical protein